MHGADKKNISLKYLHNDQCSRLQQRYQNEAQLLEDLRLFVKQKSVVEKAYGQSLMKLCQQFSGKIAQTTLAKSRKNSDNSILLTDAWGNYLGKVEEIGKLRVQSSEHHAGEVSEICKHIKNHRTQVAKLVFEHLSELQKEVLQSSQETQKSQKSYKEKYQKTREGQLKVRSLTERTKSPSKVQSQIAQLTDELTSHESKSDSARNSYLLDVASSNAHLNEYRTNHLPELMQLIDGEFYEDWKMLLSRATELERKNCRAVMKCCDDINKSYDMVSRDYDFNCFLIDNPCFTDTIESSFVPHNGDKINQVVLTPSTRLELEREARGSSMLAAREEKALEKCMAELGKIKLEGVEEKANNYETYLNLKRVIMASKTRRQKALSRLKALKDGGVDVTTWMNEATTRMQKAGRDEDESDSFELNVKAAPVRRDRSPDDVVSNKTIGDDQNAAYPYWCSALYDYEAVNVDELSFKEDDRLKMIGDGSGDGWLWAENVSGTVGLVPQNYISTYEGRPSSQELANQAVLEEESANQSIFRETTHFSVLRAAPPPPNKKAEKEIELKRESRLLEVAEEPRKSIQIDEKPPDVVKLSDEDVFWVRALYGYEATCDEEISFSEGQLIKVTTTSRDVDDGWWEGEVKGKRGIFPSMIVEEMFVVSPGKQIIHEGSRGLSESSWKSSFDVSSGMEEDPEAKYYRHTITPSEDNNNNNNNNNNLCDDDEDTQINYENNVLSYTSSTLNKIPISSNLGDPFNRKLNGISQTPNRYEKSFSYFNESATLGRKISYNDKHPVTPVWNSPPNYEPPNLPPSLMPPNFPQRTEDNRSVSSTTSHSARSSRQRPWNRPTDSTHEVQTPTSHPQSMNHQHDFSTLPRSHRIHSNTGMNPTMGFEPTNPGMEVRSNYLGSNRDSFDAHYRSDHQPNHDYNFGHNKDFNSPSYNYMHKQTSLPPLSNDYQNTRKAVSEVGHNNQRPARGFRLASESRESYI